MSKFKNCTKNFERGRLKFLPSFFQKVPQGHFLRGACEVIVIYKMYGGFAFLKNF